MNSIAKSESNFDYTQCDYLHNFAKDGGMAFRGHNTCWANVGQPYYQPDFIRNESDPAKIESFLKKFIQTTMARYSGKAIAWDVVNEAIDGNGPNQFYASPWAKVDDFVCKAFKWAHEADPHAELFYNDFNHASSTGWQKRKSDKIYNLVKDLKARDCGIHGIGFQLHVDVDFQASGVIANMKRYKDLGIKVHFTEIDVKCRKSNGHCVPWTDELLIQQANTYKALLKACLEAENCDNFETWGFTDKYSWLPKPMDGLPFDENFAKKPAYKALLETLRDFPRDHPAVIARTKSGAQDSAEFLQ